jgi:nucleoside diphosphate kinase
MSKEAFVINGFYMSMREKYTKAYAKIHYYVVSWDGDKLSWADFRGKVLGATDPETAEAGSVRRMILDKWEELGLKSRPDVGDNGVHASASPFEALAERLNWLGASMEEKGSFGEEMLKTIPKDTILAWTKDPQVELEGKKGSCFDYLEDTNTSECLAIAQKIAGVAEQKASNNTNTAFVFIKPHACVSDKVAPAVSEAFKAKGITIVSEGDIDGPTIEKNLYIDNHYYAIANKASLTLPKDLNPPQKGQDEFKAKFGVSWPDALEQGLVYNAVDGCKFFGVDGDQMDSMWAKSKKGGQLVKFGGGFYAGLVSK